MVLASESFYNNHRANDNTASEGSARINDINFDPLGLLAEARSVVGTSSDESLLNSFPRLTLDFGTDDATDPNNAVLASAVAVTDIVTAVYNEAKTVPDQIMSRLGFLPDPPEGAKETIMARFAEAHEENEDDDSERDPHDAPRSGPTVRVIGAPKDGEYGPDGHIVSGTDSYEDGSTRFVRYYPPVEIDGVFHSRPQEQTISRPDGSSEYTRYTPDGEIELIQNSSASGYVTTYSRRADGTYNGRTNYPDGAVVEGIYNSDFTPRETVENRPDGSVSTVRYDENSMTMETREANGWVHTTRSTREGRIIEHVTQQPDGSRRVATYPADGTYLTQNYSPTGQLVGSYSLPPEFRGHFVQFLNNGGVRIDMNSPTGTRARSITLDGTGRVVSENSMYPDGRVRETVTYDHAAGTRSITRFDARGVQTQRIGGQTYTPPTYAVPAPR